MGWFTLLLTTLGACAAGAIITTYGTQSRERRSARAEVRACLQRADRLARNPQTPGRQLFDALADVENAAFIAAVPRHVVKLYDEAVVAAFRVRSGMPGSGHEIEILLAASDAQDLMVRVLWHPWLMLPVRRIRARHIRQYLHSGLDVEEVEALGPAPLFVWLRQRQTIRGVKRARRQNRDYLDDGEASDIMDTPTSTTPGVDDLEH